MLNPKYRYIWLDFETTGLDPKKDEPIQIWIVEIDSNGHILHQYSSLIKPAKKTDELKDIVWFITWFSISDLEHAPSRIDILSEILKFFDETTVVIWHNIQFDLNFLQEYFPELKYALSLDTFQLSQTLVHYAPSYALEVLIQHLQEKTTGILPWLKIYSLLDEWSKDNFHDALHDTKNSLALCMYLIESIHTIVGKYQNLVHFLNQENSLFSKILFFKNPTISRPIKFPVLEKINPSATSLQKNEHTLDLKTLENGKKYYVGNMDIKFFLTRIASNKNIILAFSNLQKLEIAKTILHHMGIKNIWFAKEEQTISEQRFYDFLNKGIFSHEEVLFVLKYLSHLYKWYGTLDLNNKFDYQVYSYIKDTRDRVNYPIVLTTHTSLFSLLHDTSKNYSWYDICFFDVDWWYKNYNFFLSRPCDLYYTLNFLETLLYKKSVESQIICLKTNENWCQSMSTHLEDFYRFFQIFIWELSIETKKLFTNTAYANLQHDPIMGHSHFYQTNTFLIKIPEYLENIKNEISDADFLVLSSQIAHMFHVFNSIVTINKKMYAQSDFYFVYSEHCKFTSWQEFMDLYKDSTVFFFSNTNIQYPKLSLPAKDGTSEQQVPSLSIQFMEEKVDQLVAYLSDTLAKNPGKNMSFFIVSTVKQQSTKIFEELYKKRIHTQALLLVENITWWVGKNIFKAKQTPGNKILVWWYSFLLYVYANSIPLDEVIIFNINGPSKQHILDDIKWYAFK